MSAVIDRSGTQRRSAPVNPSETDLRMRAQSLLSGMRFKDGSTQAPVLTIEQARDVLAWCERGGRQR